MAVSERTAVVTREAPGPYPILSQAVVHNGLVFTSGSIGMNPQTNTMVEGTIADRTVSLKSFIYRALPYMLTY